MVRRLAGLSRTSHGKTLPPCRRHRGAGRQVITPAQHQLQTATCSTTAELTSQIHTALQSTRVNHIAPNTCSCTITETQCAHTHTTSCLTASVHSTHATYLLPRRLSAKYCSVIGTLLTAGIDILPHKRSTFNDIMNLNHRDITAGRSTLPELGQQTDLTAPASTYLLAFLSTLDCRTTRLGTPPTPSPGCFHENNSQASSNTPTPHFSAHIVDHRAASQLPQHHRNHTHPPHHNL